MKREKLYYVIHDDEISSSISVNLDESVLDGFISAVDNNGRIFTETGFVQAWYNCEVDSEFEHLRIIEFQTCSCGWRGPVHHLIRRTESSLTTPTPKEVGF